MARTHHPPLWQPVVRSSRKRKLVNYLDEDSDFDLEQPTNSLASRPVRQSRRIRTYNEQDTSSDNAETDSINDSSAIENTPSLRRHPSPSSIPPGQKVTVVIPRRKGWRRKTTHNTLFSDAKRRKP